MRSGEVKRRTNETDIAVSLLIDGTGKADIATGVGFFDHMLDLFARHSLIDLTVIDGGLYQRLVQLQQLADDDPDDNAQASPVRPAQRDFKPPGQGL